MDRNRKRFASSHRAPAAAAMLVFCVALTIEGADGSGVALRVSEDADSVRVFAGDREILEYRRVPSPNKPYVRKLYSPGGIQVLRDEPADHRHHHALMFALGANGVNFWEERDGGGLQRPRSTKLLKGGRGQGAGLSQRLDWVDPGSNGTVLVELRSISMTQEADPPATVLTWQTRLEAHRGGAAVQLGGSHYFGLGLRFVESMDLGGRFFNAEGLEGETVRRTEKLTAVRWCAYAAAVDGRPVTVAVLDHPRNPRHPARMFTMTSPFAYLAATMNLWKDPWEVRAGRPLTLTYGVVVWDGDPGLEQVEALYRRWAR